MTPPGPSSKPRRVLIISPNFAPLNTPDMQRARLALPFLREHGWEPVVLALVPEHSGTGVMDPVLEETYPADIRIVRVRGIPPKFTRWLGIGSIWWRCGGALRRAAEQLLQAESFDLVFFSTTVFDLFTFGPLWRRRFGIPYVLDYQDPWINRYYERTGTRPPGGWAKFGITQWIARRREPAAVKDAAGIVSVSNDYLHELVSTYGLDPNRTKLLPFGSSPLDFATAARHRPAAPLIDFDDGNFHHVYTGRCGPDMTLAMTVIFRAFHRFIGSHPEQAGRMRFHFIGTDYAPPPLGREWAMPIAVRENVDAFVREHCYRVPYFDALHYLLRANALTVIGSNDPTYSASKLFPYVLARRPMLVVFHEHSPVLRFAREIGTGLCLSFRSPDDVPRLADEVYRRWFVGGECQVARPFDELKFAPFTAANVTRELAEFFDASIARGRSKSD